MGDLLHDIIARCFTSCRENVLIADNETSMFRLNAGDLVDIYVENFFGSIYLNILNLTNGDAIMSDASEYKTDDVTIHKLITKDDIEKIHILIDMGGV